MGIAEDDLSGKTKGVFTTKRLCGDAAKKSAETMGAAFVKRTKAGDHDPTTCFDDSGDKKVCLSPGIGEGDVAFAMEYKKAGDGWTLIGIQSTAMGVTHKQDDDYAKLLTQKCK